MKRVFLFVAMAALAGCGVSKKSTQEESTKYSALANNLFQNKGTSAGFSKIPSLQNLVKILPGKFKNAQIKGTVKPVAPPAAKAETYTSTSAPTVDGPNYFVYQLCAASYPTDPSLQETCVENLTQFLYDNHITIGGTIGGPQYATFQVSVPGMAEGSCLELYIPNILIGIACVGNAGGQVGGAYAGCTIFSGCGSAAF